MTTTTAATSVAAPRTAACAAAVGCGLLVLRPLLLQTSAPATPLLIALFAALLAVGGLWPNADGGQHQRVAATLAIGIIAFAAARVLGGGHAPHTAVPRLVVLNTLAAIAEEAFFRRFVYRLLEPNGATLAVVGSATLFALVHITVYGAWVLPIDLGAGLLLSWQRWASGSWRVPAVTHVLANILVVI
ncbi:MAG TPA: CPBP family intramembrane glutamic endopeptidase [Acidimicrobiales bacterium]|nr:CPBP family intramembrane glutamic endopeptidase [Acidimicrobiales bacterium]